MRTGRPKAELVMSAEERTMLEGWMRRRKSAQAVALRAGMVLDCASGMSNTAVARRRRVSKQMVGKWRERFVRLRAAGLLDEPRCGAPRMVKDAQIEAVVVRTLESAPRDATHWSTRSMAESSGLSHMTIQRIWKAFGLEPHRSETFKLSTDPQFVEKVRDIVGLYLEPPDRALVLCVDEKTQIQALDRSQPVLPMRPGQAERRSHDYARHGTTPLFAALDAKTGKVVGDLHRRHRSVEFRKFLDSIEASVPPGWDVHLILDNYGTHKTDMIRRWLGQASALSCAFHAHRSIVDQPGRTLLRSADREANSAGRSSQHTRTGTNDSPLPRHLQRNCKAFCLDQNGRSNPGQRGQILSANFSYRTLASRAD